MKTRLSIPSTISRAERVTRESQISGFVTQSKVKNSMVFIRPAELVFSHA